MYTYNTVDVWLGMSNGFHSVQTYCNTELTTILLLHIHSHVPYSKFAAHDHTPHSIVIHCHLFNQCARRCISFNPLGTTVPEVHLHVLCLTHSIMIESVCMFWEEILYPHM